MAKRKKKSEESASATASFVLTIPMNCEPWLRHRLDKVFASANKLYNLLVSERLNALKQLERTRRWKRVTKQLEAIYSNKDLTPEERETELSPLWAERNEMLNNAGFSEYSFHHIINQWRKPVSKEIGSHVAQAIASSVWHKFDDYLFHRGKEIRFRNIYDCYT